MELLEACFVDWLLFSLFEGILYVMFFNLFFDDVTYDYKDVLVISIGSCIISNTIIFCYQMYMILFMFYYNYSIKKVDLMKSIKFATLALIFTLTTEMVFAMFYELVLNIDFTKADILLVFKITIPIRIVQLLLLRIGGESMKSWIGTGVSR